MSSTRLLGSGSGNDHDPIATVRPSPDWLGPIRRRLLRRAHAGVLTAQSMVLLRERAARRGIGAIEPVCLPMRDPARQIVAPEMPINGTFF